MLEEVAIYYEDSENDGDEADNEEDSEDEPEGLKTQYELLQRMLIEAAQKIQIIVGQDRSSSDVDKHEKQDDFLQHTLPDLMSEISALKNHIQIAQEKNSFVFVTSATPKPKTSNFLGPTESDAFTNGSYDDIDDSDVLTPDIDITNTPVSGENIPYHSDLGVLN